jgi:hypothetical protein
VFYKNAKGFARRVAVFADVTKGSDSGIEVDDEKSKGT